MESWESKADDGLILLSEWYHLKITCRLRQMPFWGRQCFRDLQSRHYIHPFKACL